MLSFCLPWVAAEDFNPQVREVDLYSSSAQIIRQGTLNSMSQDLRIFIPRQADIETLLIQDQGAVLVQLTVESEIPDDLTRSVEAQMLLANLNKAVTLVTEEYSVSGTVKEVIRDDYVVLSNPVINDSGLSVPQANDLVLAIDQVSSMSLTITPDILDSEELQALLAKQVLTIKLQPSQAVRGFSLQYFVSGAGWNPVYQLFLEEDNDETAEIIYQAKAFNQTDEDWQNVSLKLIAGMPNLKYTPYYRGYEAYDYMGEAYKSAVPMAATDQFVSGETGELHTYVLSRPLSLKKQSNVIIPILSETVPIERKYVWEAQWSSQVMQQVNIENTSEEPWANGWISSYQDGTYIGGANLAWLAVDSDTDLTIGKAPNIEVERKQSTRSDTQPDKTTTLYGITLNLENHKGKEVTVEVKDYLPANAVNFVSSHPYERGEDNEIVWQITLQPEEKVEIENSYYTVYYTQREIVPVPYPLIDYPDEGKVIDEGFAQPIDEGSVQPTGGWLNNFLQSLYGLFR